MGAYELAISGAIDRTRFPSALEPTSGGGSGLTDSALRGLTLEQQMHALDPNAQSYDAQVDSLRPTEQASDDALAPNTDAENSYHLGLARDIPFESLVFTVVSTLLLTDPEGDLSHLESTLRDVDDFIADQTLPDNGPVAWEMAMETLGFLIAQEIGDDTICARVIANVSGPGFLVWGIRDALSDEAREAYDSAQRERVDQRRRQRREAEGDSDSDEIILDSVDARPEGDSITFAPVR